MENPKMLSCSNPLNSNGFIEFNGEIYFFNKLFRVYIRKDLVKHYRKLRKKMSAIQTLNAIL